MNDRFKTKPFDHQLEWLDKTVEMKAFAGFWEQGTGKTKFIIDTAAALWRAGEIDALFVLAPNGVHRNWLTDEIPAHMPDEIAERMRAFSYITNRSATKKHRKQLDYLFAHPDGLKILTMSYNGMMTNGGKQVAWEMLKNNRTLYVCDESGAIKSPGAKTTYRVVASGRYATYTRILDGTPVSNAPFDVYAPIRFLERDYWKQFDVGDHLTFKHTFGRFKEIPGTNQRFCIGYRQLEKLNRWITPISSRILKKDVVDLPPQLYSVRRFDMIPEQRRHYEELQTTYRTKLRNGEILDASLTIVRMLRLQQIASGYLPTEEGVEEPCYLINEDRNPRMDVLKEIVEYLPHQFLIWARFRMDIDLIIKALGHDKVARYDGALDGDQREESKRRFKDGDVQGMVLNPAVGGQGHTFNEAKTMIYYTNSFKLRERLQSEARNHRIGQDESTNIIDILANSTIDLHIRRSLRNKKEVSDVVLGDEHTGWLA